MYNGNKTFRRWHRHVNKNQRRLAVASALAASAIPALVSSRGHRIEGVPEIPFVIDDAVAALTKTSEAVKFLKVARAIDDVEKVDASRHVRPTKGKWRNRRYISRKGPLLILVNRHGAHAFNNVRGLDIANVDSLNLLQLAPGGHLGRFVIWTKAAFERLQTIFGTVNAPSTIKGGFCLPMPRIRNEDITRVINSAEIQKVVRGKRKPFRAPRTQVNPLRNRAAFRALSAFSNVQLHNRAVADRARAKAAANRHKSRRAEVKARRESSVKALASNKKKGAAAAPAKGAKPAQKPAAKAAPTKGK